MNGKIKKAIIGIIIVTLLACIPLLSNYGYKYVTHLRQKMQERFSEIHEALNGGEDEPFGDNGLSPDEVKARDNVVAAVRTSADMIDWQVLAKADTKMDGDLVTPVFTADIKKLDGQTLTTKGYMFPLDAFGKQSHFLLSPYPPSCPFCLPAGPNELIEIVPDDPVKFTYDPITVKGKFELLQTQKEIEQGMFYRMEKAEISSN
jgi:hypothetical protein